MKTALLNLIEKSKSKMQNFGTACIVSTVDRGMIGVKESEKLWDNNPFMMVEKTIFGRVFTTIFKIIHKLTKTFF